MKILIAGGGTGGHIYPALSIAKEFRKNGHTVIMVGRKESLEEKIYSENGFNVSTIHSALLEFSPGRLFRFIVNISRGITDSVRILKREKPDAVIGAGGYVSAPILFSAYIMKIKHFIYEQNIIPGRTNRFFSKSASGIFLGFPDVYHYFDEDKTLFSGNPVRENLFYVGREEALDFFHLPHDKKVLLVFGGSGGARKLNFTFARILKELLQKFDINVIFITGNRDFPDVKNIVGELPKSVILLPYLSRMEYALKAADFALSRAGAMTLSELVHSKLPALVVPFPYARDNHQFKNALFLKERGCLDILNEKDLSEESLLKELFYYLQHIDIIKRKMESCADFFPANSAEIIYRKVIEKIYG